MTMRHISFLLLAGVWQAGAIGETVFSGHFTTCRGVSFKPDGSQVVIASEDNPMNLVNDPPSVYNIDGTNKKDLAGHMGPVWDTVFDNVNGARLVSASADGTIKVWSFRASGEWEEDVTGGLTGHAGHVMCADWHPSNANKFVTADSSGSFIIWTYDTNALSLGYQTWSGNTVGIALPSSWNVDFEAFDGIPSIITDIKYKLDNSGCIAMVAYDFFGRIYCPATDGFGNFVWNINWLGGPGGPTHLGGVWGIAWSTGASEGKYVVTGSLDRLANVFENTAGGWIFKQSLSISIFDWSWTRTCPSGMPGGCDDEIGCACPAPHYIGGAVWSVGFYEDMPITGDADHRVRMWGWNGAEYVPQYTFDGCMAPPWDIAISRDGAPKILVGCGSDPTARLWTIPAAGSLTTTTSTAPALLWQGAGQRTAPALFALFALLIGGMAQH